jgi:hypothetical protein
LAFAEKGGYQFGKLTRCAVFEMSGFGSCYEWIVHSVGEYIPPQSAGKVLAEMAHARLMEQGCVG